MIVVVGEGGGVRRGSGYRQNGRVGRGRLLSAETEVRSYKQRL